MPRPGAAQGSSILPLPPTVQYRQPLSIGCVCLVLLQQSRDSCTSAQQQPLGPRGWGQDELLLRAGTSTHLQQAGLAAMCPPNVPVQLPHAGN